MSPSPKSWDKTKLWGSCAGRCEVTGLGSYYCPESNEFYPDGRAVGLCKKDWALALKSCQYFSIQSQTTALGFLGDCKRKLYGRAAEELISHQTHKRQTFICQIWNNSCLLYVWCLSLNSSYELRDGLLQWKFLSNCPNTWQYFAPK